MIQKVWDAKKCVFLTSLWVVPLLPACTPVWEPLVEAHPSLCALGFTSVHFNNNFDFAVLLCFPYLWLCYLDWGLWPTTSASPGSLLGMQSLRYTGLESVLSSGWFVHTLMFEKHHLWVVLVSKWVSLFLISSSKLASLPASMLADGTPTLAAAQGKPTGVLLDSTYPSSSPSANCRGGFKVTHPATSALLLLWP